MKYFWDSVDGRDEITYKQALRLMLTTYKDNDITRNFLKTRGSYPTRFGDVEVKDD